LDLPWICAEMMAEKINSSITFHSSPEAHDDASLMIENDHRTFPPECPFHPLPMGFEAIDGKR
jgi:hypothetical protein